MVERSLTAGPFHWLGLAAVALSALAADQLTKQIVVTQLGLGESVHVVGPFWIRHVNNPGIAFGLFSSWASAVTFLLRIGHVTDFLDLRFWPAFNLADTFIVVGVAALLLALVAAERQPRIRRTPSGRPAPKTLG